MSEEEPACLDKDLALGGKALTRRDLDQALRHHADLSHLVHTGNKVMSDQHTLPGGSRSERASLRVRAGPHTWSLSAFSEICAMAQTKEQTAELEGHTRKQAHEDRGYGCIYKITRRATGKAYVGLTTRRFRQRINGHRNKADRPLHKIKKDKGCRKLHYAIRKYGWDAFDAKVLYAEVPTVMLPVMEIMAISQHGTLTPGGYNLTPGGETSPMLNPIVRARARKVMQSEEVVAKREKVFSSEAFKAKVGKEAKAVWGGYTAEERNARAEHMAAASRRGWVEKREAKMAGMTPRKAKAYWQGLRNKGLERARRMLLNHPERYVGRNPIAEVEE